MNLRLYQVPKILDQLGILQERRLLNSSYNLLKTYFVETGIHPDLQTNIKLSYEYGIFYGYKDGVFKPNDFISNDEIIAVMVRLVTNKYDDASGTNRAANYKKTLNNRTTVKLGNTLRGSIIQVVFNLYKENEYVFLFRLFNIL